MYARSSSLIAKLEEKAPQLKAGGLLLLASRIGDTLFSESESAKKKVLQRALLSVEDGRFAPVIRARLPELLSEFTSVALIARRVVDGLFPDLFQILEKTPRGLPLTQEDALLFQRDFPVSSSLMRELEGLLESRVKTAFQEIDSAREELEEKLEALMEAHPEADTMKNMVDAMEGAF
jgi:hypothetical protein